MSVEFKIKVVKIGNSLRITIPKEITEFLKIIEGDTVILTVNDGNIYVKKQKIKKIRARTPSLYN